MRRHFTALLLSSVAVSLIASSAAAQSSRDSVVQITIEKKTPVFETPSLAANTVIMAPPSQFVIRSLEIQNGFIRVPLRSIKASLPAGDGWITGGEVSARVVRVRADTVTVVRADTVLKTRVDSATRNTHPQERRE